MADTCEGISIIFLDIISCLSFTRCLVQLPVANTYLGQEREKDNGSSVYILFKNAKSSLELLTNNYLHFMGQH